VARITLVLPPHLANHFGMPSHSSLEAPTLALLLAHLEQLQPTLQGLTDPEHGIHQRMRIFLNEIDIHRLHMEGTDLVEGDQLALAPLTREIPASSIDSAPPSA